MLLLSHLLLRLRRLLLLLRRLRLLLLALHHHQLLLSHHLLLAEELQHTRAGSDKSEQRARGKQGARSKEQSSLRV